MITESAIPPVGQPKREQQPEYAQAECCRLPDVVVGGDGGVADASVDPATTNSTEEMSR